MTRNSVLKTRNSVLTTRIFALKTRIFVFKMRKSVFKMMNLAGHESPNLRHYLHSTTFRAVSHRRTVCDMMLMTSTPTTTTGSFSCSFCTFYAAFALFHALFMLFCTVLCCFCTQNAVDNDHRAVYYDTLHSLVRALKQQPGVFRIINTMIPYYKSRFYTNEMMIYQVQALKRGQEFYSDHAAGQGDFEFKMMNFAFKMMNFALKMSDLTPRTAGTEMRLLLGEHGKYHFNSQYIAHVEHIRSTNGALWDALQSEGKSKYLFSHWFCTGLCWFFAKK